MHAYINIYIFLNVIKSPIHKYRSKPARANEEQRYLVKGYKDSFSSNCKLKEQERYIRHLIKELILSRKEGAM